MDFQETDEIMDEDYPFISRQNSEMLENTAKFQDAYVLMRIYDEAYKHYKDTYGEEVTITTMHENATGYATYVINKLYARG